MTDDTQPEAREFTMSQYASKDDMIGAMRKRIAELEAEIAGGVQAISAEPAQAVVQDDLITLRKPTTSAEMLWLLKLAHLVISDVGKTLEESVAPAQPVAEPSRFGSPELQAMIIARCVEKDQADSVQEDACHAPPLGWRCTRKAGHEGPCAAVEYEDEKQFVERGMQRIRDAEDAALWRWLAEYLVGTRTDLDDEIVASETVNDLRKLVKAAIKQGEKQ